MKFRFLPILKSLLPVLFVIGSVSVFAQPPANDKCGDAIELEIAASKGDCTPIEGDTRNTTDGNLDNIPACSVNFKRDDVWYKFVAPDAQNGWSLEFEFGSKPTDITTVGFAIYASCQAAPTNQPLYCAVESLGRGLNIQACPDLTPGTEYLLRVWSAVGVDPNWQEGWGTFRICAYENEPIVGTIIWGDEIGEGDFSGGINDWTSVGVSCGGGQPAENAAWVWDPIGSALAGAYAGGQVNNSPSYCNGAMVFNSDFLDNGGTTTPAGAPNTANGTCNAPQESSLVSPLIDISGFSADAVSVEFHQSLRHFQTRYFVGYSVDGGQNWIDIQINQEYETNGPHINATKRVPLPGAAGSSNLRLRFRAEANYYYWVIDDVRIIEQECNNLSANPFFAFAPNAQWQKDQLVNFGALIDIENLGSCEQTNTKVDFEVRNAAGDLIVSGTKDYGTVAIGEVAENQIFSECFSLPAGTPVGTYTGTYRVYSDAEDFTPNDNSQSFTFLITEDVMGKELPGTATAAIRATNFPNWSFGNGYYISNGEDFQVCEVEIGIGNASTLRPSVLGAQAGFLVYLYEVTGDANGDGHIDLGNDAVQVGFAQYDFTNDDVDNTIYRLELFNDDFEPCVTLKNNRNYALFAQYTEPAGITGTLMTVLSSNQSYVANNFMYAPTGAGGLGSPCIRHYGDLVDLGNTGTLLSDGTTFAPLVRMILDRITSTDPVDGTAASFTIMPNPVSNEIRVDMNFANVMDRVVVRITDLNGRTIIEDTQSFVQPQSTWTRDVSRFANGAYFLSIVSEEGVRTERFVIQH